MGQSSEETLIFLSEVEAVFQSFVRQEKRMFSLKGFFTPFALYKDLYRELDGLYKQIGGLRGAITKSIKDEIPGTEARELLAAVKRYSDDLNEAVSFLRIYARRIYWMRSSVKEYPAEESKVDSMNCIDAKYKAKETRSATRHVFTIRGYLD